MSTADTAVAIVGMAGRFPGAASIDEFWRNLANGTESIRRFDAQQLSPLIAPELRAHPRYVPARGVITGAENFDAAFFGIAPGEAQLMDPQQRVFLELCWNALEHAGIGAPRPGVNIGVYAGVSNNGYRRLVETRPELIKASGEFAAMLANEKDYVATRVAHRIGLHGPAISLYTACSTSLVAVAQAWYALMSWQCDAALAGGINIVVPQESGYIPVDGGMESSDGHCRPFDAQASGTVFSSGGGVVVLKRLTDALADRDHIWAVIRGVGVNNDGGDKASFTAPSARGQAEAIRLALSTADVSADSIGYVEAHGTGTALGDPIEVEALTRAYRAQTAARQYCWLGSVKSNIGHLVAGSGVAGLIKAALALHYERIPPTLHYTAANPEIDFAETPFKVPDHAVPWPRTRRPRRAGVSSFGVGGTNAHVILEEAPALPVRAALPSRPVVLTLSARDEQRLRDRAADLSAALANHTDEDLGDIGWSLATGRRHMRVRGAVVAETIAQAQQRLGELQAQNAIEAPRIVFMFPGQGSQHAGMARELVHAQPAFGSAFEHCCALASDLLGCDLRKLILPESGAADAADRELQRTRYAQPALFAVEYALARLWQSWGVEPAAMIGHSIGEYVAACIAGVFSLEDAMRVVVARAVAMDEQHGGAMLAVRAREDALAPYLRKSVEIAAINAPDSTVVSGSRRAIDALARRLEEAKIACSRLRVSHAFHSAAMDGALPILRRAFESVRLCAPTIAFYSCTSGKLIDTADATSAEYWCRQLRMPVRFADAADDAMRDSNCIALEVGPGQALGSLLRRKSAWRERVVTSLGRASEGSAAQQLAAAAGRMWCLGATLDWDRYDAGEEHRRVPLPGYPFRGPRYWIDALPAGAGTAASERPARADAVEPAMDLHAQLRELVGALSGESLSAANNATRLLDLGLDSLALTQAALEIERRFGLKLKLRRLMEDVDSIDKLAELLEKRFGKESVRVERSEAQLRGVETPASPSTPALRAYAQGERDIAPAAFGAAARITLAADTPLQPRQRRWLDDFITRYTSQTAQSKAFNERHRAVMADPRVVTGFNPLWKELVYPLVVARSEGARLWDIDGREYIDLLNAFGANFLGYQPAFIKRALAEQLETGFEIGPQHPLTAEVAQLISEMTGVERVAFCNTGSEAVMGAMRIARTVTGRKTIVIFKDSYHGIFDEVIVRGTPQLRSIAAAPGILANAVENVLVLDYGSAAALDVIRARGAEFAAVMIEPVQSRNPSLQPREFVRALRELCNAHGCALIFDEVITGFRVSPGGAQEFYGVRADIATYGKIIGGGLPFAAIGGDARWMDALDGGGWHFGDASRPEAGVTYFAGTFVRHPLALAAAKAALLHLRENGAALQRALNARTAALAARLNAFFEQQRAPMRVDWFSSLWRIRIDADQPLADLFHYALRERGLHVYAQFGFFLSTAHGDAEVDEIATRIEAATLELLDAGILNRRAQVAAPQPEAAPPPHARLTPGQAERWAACQFGEQANVAFNESMLLYLHGELNRSALETSIARVCARHEAFAMSFAPDGTALRIAGRNAIAPTYVDLAATGETVHAHCTPVLRRPFDLARAPLARIELLHISDHCHALLVVAHHLVLDGWSAAVFLDEIARGYRALASGCEPDWPQAESFREFAVAQEQRGAAASAQLEYWKRIYSTLPEALALPTDRPPPAQREYAADTIFHDFAPEFSAALRNYARQHAQTTYSVLLAALGVLLARLSGQSDFVIDIPFAAQAVAGNRCLIGDGVNTLPVRLLISADETFLALSQRCQQLLLDAAENQDVTVHALQNALGQNARSGVFNSLVFNLNPRMPALDFGNLEYSLRDGAKTALISDLFFNFNDSENQLNLDLHYSTALFDAATVRRWIDHFQILLGAAMGDAYSTVATLPLLEDAQRTRIVHECDASARNYNLDVALTDLIREQALRTPRRTAIECDGRSVSYEGLASRAHALARTLRARSVGQGDVVGICMPRGIEMVVGLLGIMASGAAYLPLDPAYPAERLRLVADDAAVQHLLVLTREQIPPAIAHGRKVHAFDEFAAPPAVELPHVSGSAPAYVLYTSGSSGTPKGVRVLHRNLVNCLLSMSEEPGLTASDVLCAIAPLTFDIAALELYLPLLVGAKVLLASDTERRDPDMLLALMQQRAVTVLQATPSWLRALTANERRQRLPRMKLLIGGEELPRDLAERVLPQCRELWNLYGPTETTIWCTRCRVESGAGAVPIGRPVANTYIYVVDQHGQIAAPGARGEIWIGGAGIADGYLRPGLTEERFINDPFRAGAPRVYRTGDIGSWRDGRLHFHGRRDAQFKLRGFRIEPAEIERAALAMPGVRAAVATLFARSTEDKRLVLYVAASATTPEFSAQLRDRLRRSLPPHMVPQYIELLNTLPQTAHGKIDRKALPPPRPAPAPVEETAAEPVLLDGVTRALLQIWKDLLGTDQVTLDANFFDAGGDSLLGVQLFQRAQKITGVNLPLSTLLTAQTVREQARAFREAGAHRGDRHNAPQRSGNRGKWSPLVPIQESGSRPPLFCVHALGGNVLNYVPLARALGPDQPVYGLQAIGLDGISPPLTTIEQMAARYLPEIRGRCPHGPYYLCGGSMGGLIAYELAQMLGAQGEQVALLGMFDTYGPGCMIASATALGHWRERWMQLRQLDAGERRIALVNACARRFERSRDALQHAWCRWRGTALPHDARYRTLERIHWRADFAYRARAYSGMVNLFRAREQPQAFAGMHALGWETVALGGVRVIDLPGTHETLIEQPELATALRAVLEGAQHSAADAEIVPSFRLAG